MDNQSAPSKKGAVLVGSWKMRKRMQAVLTVAGPAASLPHRYQRPEYWTRYCPTPTVPVSVARWLLNPVTTGLLLTVAARQRRGEGRWERCQERSARAAQGHNICAPGSCKAACSSLCLNRMGESAPCLGRLSPHMSPQPC